MEKTKIIGSATAKNSGDIYKTDIVTGAFSFIVDEPVEYGGQNAGPAPADYLCMALASCKAITVRMYVQRKGWNVSHIDVSVNLVKGSQASAAMNTFLCTVLLQGELNDEQRKRILDIAKICPIERLLGKMNDVVTVLEYKN
ncbi:MAG TPA: OsmC family protein [Flavisolibacter sp.]|nr:OsmC family protein [Flavisolibacter sp.]